MISEEEAISSWPNHYNFTVCQSTFPLF